MNLLSLFKRANKTSKPWLSFAAHDTMAQIPEAVIGMVKVPSIKRTRVSSPTIGYKKAGFLEDYNRPEYDLVEIARSRDTESYIRLAFDQLKARILREPWAPKGRNSTTVAYILSRLREIELATGISFNSLIRQISSNVVQFSNAFVVKVRDSRRSTGQTIRRFGRDLAPIAGLFSVDPCTMHANVDDHGNPIRWRQITEGGSEVEFRRESVVHIAYDRMDGFIFGTPWILPALDDVRLLRRIEELSGLLIGKHVFPLLHYRVGTEKIPAQEYDDGTTEIDDVRNAIQEMPTEGVMVTDERHEIIPLKITPMDISPFISFFESRVLTGLRLSAVDTGRGDTSNRSTAKQLQAAKDDLARDMQDVISDLVTSHIFDDILEEGGFPLTPENRVHLSWPPIDPEEQRLREAHGTLLFQNNLVSETEVRMVMNKQPIEEGQRSELFNELYTLPKITAQVQQAEAAAAAKVKSANQPSNQNGKKLAKTAPANDQLELEDTPMTEDAVPGEEGIQHLDDYSFAMGNIIDSIVSTGSWEHLDMDAGDDGLDETIIKDYKRLLESTIADAKLTTKQRKSLKTKTFCGPSKSFPIPDCSHFSAGLRLLGRYKGPGDKARIRACIISKGRKMGCPGAEEK